MKKHNKDTTKRTDVRGTAYVSGGGNYPKNNVNSTKITGSDLRVKRGGK